MISLATASTMVLAAALPGGGPGLLAASARHLAPPAIQVWLNSDDVYHRGDRAKIYFRTDTDAYITIFRVDTDGRIRVLYPRDPWEDNYSRGERDYEILNRGRKYSFVVDDYPGEGYVFAVATTDPFDYSAVVRGDHWDYRVIANEGRIVGDPYAALMDLIDVIVPAGYTSYSYDVMPYYVEERVEYPRFLCYDCHSYVSYPYWNPYAHSCARFRIVIYDDPYYYPARRYGGTRVVYQRPRRIEPRYVFKDRDRDKPYVTRTRERPVNGTGRRTTGERTRRGVTSRDLGGVGRVPAPGLRDGSGRRRPQGRAAPARKPGDRARKPRTGRRDGSLRVPERLVPGRRPGRPGREGGAVTKPPERLKPTFERRSPKRGAKPGGKARPIPGRGVKPGGTARPSPKGNLKRGGKIKPTRRPVTRAKPARKVKPRPRKPPVKKPRKPPRPSRRPATRHN